MASWTDHPDWSDGTARLLHDALSDAYPFGHDIRELCAVVGIPPYRIHWEQSADQLWPAVTRECARAGVLAVLVREICHRKPAVSSRLSAVLDAQTAPPSWYTPRERHLSLLMGPGYRRAFLDRRALRLHLVDLIRHDYPVLAITGRSGTGKSYSRHLIQHLAEDPALRCELRIVDLEDEFYDEVTPVDFVATLARRLGLPAHFDVDLDTEQSRTVRELVEVFVGRFVALPSRLRWLFVDGLDRPHVRPGVHAVVGRLATEIERGQLPNTRLIVTGHPGDFAPSVLEHLRHEDLAEVTLSHVEDFFSGVAEHVGRELSDDELAKLVAEVLADSDPADLHLLGRKVAETAHAHFGQGGAW